MSTHMLPYPFSSMLHSIQAPVRTTRRVSLLAGAVRVIRGALLASAVVHVMDWHTRKVSTSVMALEGLTHRLMEATGPAAIDPKDTLYNELEATETDVVHMVQELQRVKHRDARVFESVQRAIQAYEAVADTVRDLRGAILAHDANVDAVSRAGAGFTSPAKDSQSLDEQLNQVFGKTA